MTNKEFINQLTLKLMGSDAKIRDLEQQVSHLTMQLTKTRAELVGKQAKTIAKDNYPGPS